MRRKAEDAALRLRRDLGWGLPLGREASEARLEELAAGSQLKRYRFLHFATHGEMDDQRALNSALLVVGGSEEESLRRALEGKRVWDGRLSAEQILRGWKLQADLVTLSACESAPGKFSGGEGFVGFSQALFVAGARSVVLSLWKVEDTATSLLMARFYESLLGQFDGPRRVLDREYAPGKPLPKADALLEAKVWLRGLPRSEVEVRKAGLGLERRTKAPVDPPKVQLPDKPFDHPFYWAAFVLMGDT